MTFRVLIIEDDPAMIDLLTLPLHDFEFDVRVIDSDRDRILQASKWTPEIIICDLPLPDGIGGDLCQFIRENSRAPLLVLSPIDKPGLVAQVLDAGADEFLLKPVTNGVLVAHVNKLARRARAEYEAQGIKLKSKQAV